MRPFFRPCRTGGAAAAASQLFPCVDVDAGVVVALDILVVCQLIYIYINGAYLAVHVTVAGRW